MKKGKHTVIHFLQCLIQHYDPDRYWRYRDKVMTPTGSRFTLALNYIRLMYIKWCDAYNNATLGTDIGKGAHFASVPDLPHGLNGIVISPNCVIGRNAKIFHQVTLGDLGRGEFDAPIIGDNVIIGAGAKIIGKIVIGDNAKIGAGAIVVENVPAGATVVGPKAVIITKQKNEE